MFELTPFARVNMRTYNPFRELEELEKHFFGTAAKVPQFRTDIKDIGSAYLLESDLPGVSKQDIDISIENGYLTVTAQRKKQATEENEQYKTIYSERSYGTYSRTFDIGAVDEESISAEYTDGVLKITLPKKQETAPAARKLEIK